MPRKKKVIEYEEDLKRLYGIRLRTKNDLKIKKALETLSQERNISIDQLILTYIEKGINIEQNLEINQKEILDNFDQFFEKLPDKIKTLDNELISKKYKKKESLKQYIDNNFGTSPKNILRKKAFLILIQTQVSSEMTLLKILLNLSDCSKNNNISYFDYYIDSHNKEDTITFLENIKQEFFNEWYYELKLYGIINKPEDIRNTIFKYKNLERFIFDIYKGRKLQKSRNEKYLESIKYLKNTKKKNTNYTKHKFLNLLKRLFACIVDFKSNDYKTHTKFITGFIKDEYDEYKINSELFEKINLKPHILYRFLDLDNYFNYLRDNNLFPNFSYKIKNFMLLYSFLSNISNISPMNLILQINQSFSIIKRANIFLEPFLEQIPNYDNSDLLQICLSLIFLKGNLTHTKHFIDSFLQEDTNDIEEETIKKLNESGPNNYENIIKSIESVLKKRNYKNYNLYEAYKKSYKLFLSKSHPAIEELKSIKKTLIKLEKNLKN